MSPKALLSQRGRARSFLVSLLLLICSAGADATDTYNPANRQLAIPLVKIGAASFTNVVVTIGSIVSPPSGASPLGDADTYNPANNQITVSSVKVGSTTYYNAVAVVSGLIAIGGVSGVDAYDGSNLAIPYVQVVGAVYTNVVITVSKINAVASGMPTLPWDIFSRATNQLTIPAAQYAGKIYTNATITVGKVKSLGGTTAAVGIYTGLSPADNLVLGLLSF